MMQVLGQLVLQIIDLAKKYLKHQMKKPLNLIISKKVIKDCRNLGIYTNTNINWYARRD